MPKVKLSTVFGKPRGRWRPAHYFVYLNGGSIGEITTPIVPGTKRHFKVERWLKKEKKFVGVFEDMETAVKRLLKAHGTDPSLPFIIEPHDLTFYDHPILKGRHPFRVDEAYYLGDSDDGLYWVTEKSPDDGMWYTLIAVGSNTIGLDFLLDHKGPYQSFRDGAEAGLQVALEWLPPRGVPVDDKDIEAIREDIRNRSERE